MLVHRVHEVSGVRGAETKDRHDSSVRGRSSSGTAREGRDGDVPLSDANATLTAASCVNGEPCGAPPGRGRCSCASTVQPSGRNALDDWGFEQLEPWLQARTQMPVGPLFCVINGRTRGRAWHPSAARAALRRRATRAGVRRRFAPHQLRHAHALDLLREGVPLNVIQRQLGHRNLGVTSIYLQGIDPDEIIQTVHAHRPPMIPASVGLALPRLR
jgi:hypothetical protein